jgi:hypothetical protein
LTALDIMDCLSSAVSNSLTFFTHDLSFFLFISRYSHGFFLLLV